MCSFHCKIWSICGSLYQVKTASLPAVCLMFNLLEAVQWSCKMSVLLTKTSDLPGYHLMLWYSSKRCIYNKGALTCFEMKPFLKRNLSCRKRGSSTYITVEKNVKHPHNLILHLVWNPQSWDCNNFSFYVLPRPVLLFYSGSSWVVAKKEWLSFGFLYFQNFFMSFLINLSNRLADLINLLSKDNEVSFALARQ